MTSLRAGLQCGSRPLNYRSAKPAVRLQSSFARTAAIKQNQPLASIRQFQPKIAVDLDLKLEPTLFTTSFALALLSASPAMAESVASNPFDGVQANSLYVTLALFLMSVPGIWSQVKRSPQAPKKRKTFEVPGPSQPGAMPMDDRARQIFAYFKKYNYEVKGTGDVITFVGLYAPDKGQAAAVTFYTFCGMASIALVLSTLFPEVGGWWYSLCLLSPGAWFYYYSKGTRLEEVKVKMVTMDDDMTTDILIEGDPEEITRISKELQLVEKGMVYVKGILESS